MKSCSMKSRLGLLLFYECLSIYKLKTISSDRASPSTREAIAGMLSISEQCYSAESENPKKPGKSTRKVHYEDDEDDQSIENIDKVHQDDDFSTSITCIILSRII